MNRIKRLQRQAEGNFRNFEGVTYGRGYNNAVAPGAGPMRNAEVLDPNDRTWTINVANSNTVSTGSIRIFGAAIDLTDNSLPGGITITVSESSHLQLKTELLTTAVRILGLKYTVTTAAQFNNTLSLVDNTSTGATNSRVWQPLNYRSAQNQITTQIDAPNFEMLVSATSYIQFALLASETVTFTFTIVEKALTKNILRQQPVVAASTQMAPTGLPQIDMKRGL